MMCTGIGWKRERNANLDQILEVSVTLNIYIFFLLVIIRQQTSEIISTFINSSTTERNLAILCIVYPRERRGE